MLITTFVFIGIEGASVYSRYAKKREDVGKATVLGFLSVLSIFALVTLSSYSVVAQPDLADTRQPSMIGVFQSVVGDWGKVFISVAVIVSVLGAYLAWTLMAAEVMYIPARNEDFPEFLGRENAVGTPITALVVTSLAIQGLLAATVVLTDALNFMLDLSTALALIPYLLAAAYALKLGLIGESYDGVSPGTRVGVIGGILLGLGRALGETMAVTFVIGNAHKISASLLAPGTTISATIANEFTEAVGDLYTSALVALGLILFLITFIVLAAARLMLMRIERRLGA